VGLSHARVVFGGKREEDRMERPIADRSFVEENRAPMPVPAPSRVMFHAADGSVPKITCGLSEDGGVDVVEKRFKGELSSFARLSA
jgi:hypothetical protein